MMSYLQLGCFYIRSKVTVSLLDEVIIMLLLFLLSGNSAWYSVTVGTRSVWCRRWNHRYTVSLLYTAFIHYYSLLYHRRLYVSDISVCCIIPCVILLEDCTSILNSIFSLHILCVQSSISAAKPNRPLVDWLMSCVFCLFFSICSLLPVTVEGCSM